MPSLNLMFHVFSALALVGLVSWGLILQTQVRFHQRLWKALSSPNQQILVEWPERLLQRLGRAWNLELVGTELKSQPQKIDIRPWVLCHADLSILAVTRVHSKRLDLRVARPDQEDHWRKELEASLNGRFEIMLAQAGPRPIHDIGRS